MKAYLQCLSLQSAASYPPEDDEQTESLTLQRLFLLAKVFLDLFKNMFL